MGIRDLVTPPLQPSMGVGAGGGAPKGPLFLWKRGAASLLQTALLEQPHCWLPHRPKLGEPFFLPTLSKYSILH